LSGAAGWPSLDWDDDDDDIISCPNPSYTDGNVNTTSQGVYEWIPSPPLDSEPDVARKARHTQSNVFEQTSRDIQRTVGTVASLARNKVDGISGDATLGMVRMILCLTRNWP